FCVSDFDDPLHVAQVGQLQCGAVLEPGTRRQENKGQDDHADDVVLPACAFVGPEDRAQEEELDLGSRSLEPASADSTGVICRLRSHAVLNSSALSHRVEARLRFGVRRLAAAVAHAQAGFGWKSGSKLPHSMAPAALSA